MAYDKTIEGQAASAAQLNITIARLSFKRVLSISKNNIIKLNTESIYKDYMYYINRDKCGFVQFNEQSARKYMFRPKMLAYNLYNNIEFYGIILRLNHMRSVSDFTMDKLMSGIILPFTNIKDYFDEVFIKEKLPINRNGAEVEEDIRELTR